MNQVSYIFIFIKIFLIVELFVRIRGEHIISCGSDPTPEQLQTAFTTQRGTSNLTDYVRDTFIDLGRVFSRHVLVQCTAGISECLALESEAGQGQPTEFHSVLHKSDVMLDAILNRYYHGILQRHLTIQRRIQAYRAVENTIQRLRDMNLTDEIMSSYNNIFASLKAKYVNQHVPNGLTDDELNHYLHTGILPSRFGRNIASILLMWINYIGNLARR